MSSKFMPIVRELMAPCWTVRLKWTTRDTFWSRINFNHQAWLFTKCSRVSSHLSHELLPFHPSNICVSNLKENLSSFPTVLFYPDSYYLIQAFIHHLYPPLQYFKLLPLLLLLNQQIYLSLSTQKNFSLDPVFLYSYYTQYTTSIYCNTF